MKWYLKVVKENYANFNGRARRKEYWMFSLFHIIFWYGLIFLTGFLVTTTEITALGFIPVIYLLATVIPTLGVTVRRMHDVGKSGWYCLIPIYSFILAVTEGDNGPNEYGADPKGANTDEVNEIGEAQADA